MFTGIVEAKVKPILLESRPPHVFLSVERPSDFSDLKKGDSIAVNGACLTVAELKEFEIGFYIGVETQKICGWENMQAIQNSQLNLERSLKVGDRLHGHWVQGHVDAKAKLVDRFQDGSWLVLTFRVESQDANLIWKKGSITINGVSLTLNEVIGEGQNKEFKVGLIPETIERTNLGSAAVGDELNLEFDWLAKAARASFANQPFTPTEINS